MRISILATIIPADITCVEDFTPLKHLKERLEYFEIPKDKVLVMGKDTYENACVATGKPIGTNLLGRKIIILSKKPVPEYIQDNENLYYVSSTDYAVYTAYEIRTDEMIVVGGRSVHQLFFPIADRLYLIHIFGCFAGYQYFPKFSLEDWVCISRKYRDTDNKNGLDFGLKIFDRDRQVTAGKKTMGLDDISL